MRPAGDLSERVTVWERKIVRTTDGDAKTEWSLVATRWAAVEPGAGREVWQAGQSRPEVSHTVTMRTFDGLTSMHQLRWGELILNIESVIDGDDTVCACRAEV